MHVAVWPALPIVPLHPSENVVVSGAITETVLLSMIPTLKAFRGAISMDVPHSCGAYGRSSIKEGNCHIHHLLGLKAMQCKPQSMVAHNGVCCGVYHGDGVAALVCHVHEPVVRVEGNAKWT